MSAVVSATCARSLSSLQRNFARNLLKEVLPRVRLSGQQVSLSRGARKLSEHINLMHSSAYTGNKQYDIPNNIHKLPTHSLDVDPARIAIPQQAGRCDPASILTGERLDIFNNITCVIAPPGPPIGPLPHPCHRVSPSAQRHLNERLLSSGRFNSRGRCAQDCRRTCPDVA